MRRNLVAMAVVQLLLSACAFLTGASTDSGPPEEQGDLNCRIEGLLFQDLARLRDAGQAIRVAENRVHTEYQGLAATLERRTAIDLALAHRDDSAKLVYSHRNLQPATLRYFGTAICFATATGQGEAAKSNQRFKAAQDCQQQYPPATAEAQLKSCILNP